MSNNNKLMNSKSKLTQPVCLVLERCTLMFISLLPLAGGEKVFTVTGDTELAVPADGLPLFVASSMDADTLVLLFSDRSESILAVLSVLLRYVSDTRFRIHCICCRSRRTPKIASL